MILTSWLKSFRNRRRINRRSLEQRSARQLPITAEQLENKTLLSASGVLIGTELSVFADQGDDIRIQRGTTTGNVDVLITNTGLVADTIPAIQTTAVTRINIFTGSDDNVIDLSLLNVAEFSALTTINVTAGDGNDSIIGSDDFAESLLGNDGNDTIDGGDGDDTINAGDGNDSVTGGLGNDTIDGDDGDDTIDAGDGMDTITGGDGRDSILGGAGVDTIDAGNGNDTVDGGAGDDSINAQSGNDVVTGGAGMDTVFGGTGNDSISGGDDNDRLDGQGNDDTLNGDAGDDTLIGGQRNDVLSGGLGNDFINAGSGNDTASGDDGNDRILGGSGRDSLNGNSGNDTVRGQSGDDTVLGGGGQDSLQGERGDDLIIASDISDVPVILASITNATVTEGSTGTTTMTFTVSLSSAPTTAATIDYTTVDGSATAPADYTADSGTLTFDPGVASQTIAIAINPDTLDETNEVFTVVLSNAMGVTLADDTGQGFINDDDAPAPFAEPNVALAAATDYVAANAASFGITNDDATNFIVTDQYATEHLGVTHIYLRQTYQGLPIVDADINVNVAADGSIISANSSFVSNVAALGLSATPLLTADAAFDKIDEELLDYIESLHPDHDDFITDDMLHPEPDLPDSLTLTRRTEFGDRLQWVKADGGGLELAWTINVETNEIQGWYDVSVSSTDNELLHAASWLAHATYNVFNYSLEGPLYGGRSLEVDVHDVTASPFGWHDTDGVPGAEFTDTRGNNVFAQEDADANNTGGFRPDGGPNLIFDFPFDDTQPPATYQSAAITNLFYTNNILHDIHYQYGFDEVSGNFQENNYGNGGAGSDAVQADAQDGSGFNNANFGTPPDGFNPRMQQFIFNITTPNTDSDVENGIIIHEYGHGVSNRLTGGPANSGALFAIQSGGMGEGWSDWWALMFTQQAGDVAEDTRPVGNYVLGQPETGGGIRSFPYSFDMTINPLTFDDANTRLPVGSPHAEGEIWAQVLWDMNWLLIDGISTPDCNGDIFAGYGFDSDLYTGTGGNNIALQLVMDGLKLQPALPTFLDARDAILQADQLNYNGANQRAIWTAFARRGMGFSADAGANANAVAVTAAFDMPPELGSIQFDSQQYRISDTVGLTVCDADLAASSSTVDVTVTTDTGDSETVTLTRQADMTFTGTIALQNASPVAGNSALDIPGEAGLLTASYLDGDDGLGATVSLTSLAIVFDPLGDTIQGGDGQDTIFGSQGDDDINGNAGNDTVEAGDGNDSVLGGDGNDTLRGGEGNDTLDGQAGNDVIDGTTDDDVVVWGGIGSGSDTVEDATGVITLLAQGDTGNDSFVIDQTLSLLRVSEGAASITASNAVGVVSVSGGAGDDSITLQDVDDVRALILDIDGGDGNDTVTATGAGLGKVVLTINGGDGNDTVLGSLGDETINGNDGDDSLLGNTGDDVIDGGNGDDFANGGEGNDTLFGGLNNDTLRGNNGNDSISGSFGNDVLNGDAGDDNLDGGFGNDTVNGAAGNDVANGGPDQDRVLGGGGNDSLDGGTGADTIRGQAGNDAIKGGDGNDTITGDAGADTIDGGDGDDTIDGDGGQDIIAGGDGRDTINGMDGRDTIIGGDGDDNLVGGGGNDRIFGEAGDDTLRGNGSTDRFNSGEGVDVIADLGANETDDASLQIPNAVLTALATLNGF